MVQGVVATMVVLLLAAASVAASEGRFSAVWNCPYMGKSVVGKYGLSANQEGSYNGSVITLFVSTQPPWQPHNHGLGSSDRVAGVSAPPPHILAAPPAPPPVR